MSTSEPGAGSQDAMASHRQTWDTSYVRRKDRFDYFREGVCRAFLAVSPERPASGEISARMSRVQVRTGWVARIDASQHSIHRTKTDLAKMTDEYLLLSLQLSGGARLEHANGVDDCKRERGDLTLIALNDFHRVTINPGDRYANLGLIVDRKRLHDLVGGRPIPKTGIFAQGDLADALTACFRLLNARYAAGTLEEFDQICDAALSLTAASMLMDREFLQHEASEHPTLRRGLLAVVKGYIIENLSDPNLSPVIVAARFGISVRYIHKIFEKDGTTFGRFVLARRLERAHADLSEPFAAGSSISEVARRWGFCDVTAFHRSFKTCFGDSPGKVRTTRLTDPPGRA